MKNLIQIFQKVRKTFFLVNLCLLSVIMLCGCNTQQDAKESELMIQLQDKEENVSQQVTDTEIKTQEIQSETQKEITGNTVSAEGDQTLQPQREIYVYICGAVNSPGVYQTTEGSRLFEVLALAGGLSADADETCLNLARAAEDGEQLVILTKEETAALAKKGISYVGAAGGTSTGNNGTNGTAAQASGLVNINTASVSELTTVSGIGESRAQAIIAYREANGNFQTIEDIKKVDGIKDGLFSKIKDKITV